MIMKDPKQEKGMRSENSFHKLQPNHKELRRCVITPMGKQRALNVALHIRHKSGVS